MTRVVFMGTPEFAVPSLRALADDGRYDIVGVVTQPDRPAGRGKKLTACPVKQFALERGLPVFQFEKIRLPEGVAQMKALAPDVVVTAAFGQILTQELLDIPVHGTVKYPCKDGGFGNYGTVSQRHCVKYGAVILCGAKPSKTLVRSALPSAVNRGGSRITAPPLSPA